MACLVQAGPEGRSEAVGRMSGAEQRRRGVLPGEAVFGALFEVIHLFLSRSHATSQSPYRGKKKNPGTLGSGMSVSEREKESLSGFYHIFLTRCISPNDRRPCRIRYRRIPGP